MLPALRLPVRQLAGKRLLAVLFDDLKGFKYLSELLRVLIGVGQFSYFIIFGSHGQIVKCLLCIRI